MSGKTTEHLFFKYSKVWNARRIKPSTHKKASSTRSNGIHYDNNSVPINYALQSIVFCFLLRCIMLNQPKIVTVNKCYQEILQGINKQTLVDAYFGGSNLTAEYLNDYSQDGINEFIGEFIDSNWGKPCMQEYPYEASEIIGNPDIIIQGAANDFMHAFGRVIGIYDCETTFYNSKKSFKGSYSFYIFAVQWSNTCCSYYIIREDSFQEAYDELITEFESTFIIEDQEDVTENTLRNSNGEPVNIDNLVFLGEIKLTA